MDFNKMIGIGKIPIIGLVVIGILSNLLSFVPALALLALPLSLLGWLLLIYAGYLAAKAKMDIVSAGVTGAVVSLIAGIVNLVVTLVFMFAGIGSSAALLALGLAVFAIAAVIGLVIGLVFGFVLGAIGGFVGQKF
jgi:hypothetical protein